MQQQQPNHLEVPGHNGHAIEIGEQLEEIFFGPGIINGDFRRLSAYA